MAFHLSLLLIFGAQSVIVPCYSVDTGLPAIMPFSFPENVRLGQKITVMCVVSSGAGPFRYAWKHSGTALTDSSRKHVKVLAENAAALTIEAVGAEDFGNYTCTVSNTVGSATYAAALFVEDMLMVSLNIGTVLVKLRRQHCG